MLKWVAIRICVFFLASSIAGWLIALNVDSIEVEGDGGFFLAGGFGGQSQIIFKGKRVLFLQLIWMAVLDEFPIAGKMLHNHHIHRRFFEILDLDFVNL